MEDEEFNEENGLALESTEDRGGYVYLRYRDSLGRFASPDTDTERKLDIEANRKIDKFLRNYRKKIELSYNVKILLLRLVDDFRNREQLCKDGDFYIPSISHFKRLAYHELLKSCPMKKSAFSQFITRMVKQGLIVKIKHGHKLYLRITRMGLDKVFAFWEEYPGESWREP